ncbi:MAG: TusE/DsrC/DsvC family sulfur relay protein [Deltaproteobacteria bacterium]|nr:TusE/DsrC/DsvC family sulfur relay protein [Deltaproteobacteria bacterium]
MKPLRQLRVGDATIEVDEHGFVQETERWNDEVAAVLAAGEGVSELTAEHWRVVRYLRQHYLDFRVAPMIRKLCKQTGLTLKRIYELFPSGPAKGACKVAGLPNAKGCV